MFLNSKSFYCFLFLIVSSFGFSQELYLRISDKDCVSCFVATHDIIQKENIKILLPSNYQGRSFDNLNKLHFDNALSLSKVTFSDELFDLSSEFLGLESGLILLDDKDVIYYLAVSKFMEVRKLGDKVDKLLSIKKTNLADLGVSNRVAVSSSYTGNELFYFDTLYNLLFIVDKDNKVTEFDFNSINFESILKNTIGQELLDDLNKYLLEKPSLKPLVRLQFNGFDFNNEKLIFNFSVPYIIKKDKEYLVYREAYTCIISLEELLRGEFINSLYHYQEDTAQDTYRSSSVIYFKDWLYKFNLYFKDHNKGVDTPLLSKYSVEKKDKEIRFDGYIYNTHNLDFQDYTDFDFDAQKYLLDINYFVYKDNILMRKFPYALEIKQNNQLDYHLLKSDHNYQLYSGGDNYFIVHKKDNSFFLDTYSKKWDFMESDKLHYNTGWITQLFFTKESIFLITIVR